MSNTTETGSDQHILSSPLRQPNPGRWLKSHTAASMLLHARALVRLSHKRRSLALALSLTAGAAVCTAAATVATLATQLLYQVERHASVMPLAPAPAPPLPPAMAAAKPHHLLPRILHMNPLAGLASWYGDVWHGHKTASGENYDESLLTAAHKSLPLGTVVRVTNLRSMRSVIVRINDRGAFAPNRVIDLSSAAAREIGLIEQGLAQVRLEVLKKG